MKSLLGTGMGWNGFGLATSHFFLLCMAASIAHKSCRALGQSGLRKSQMHSMGSSSSNVVEVIQLGTWAQASVLT